MVDGTCDVDEKVDTTINSLDEYRYCFTPNRFLFTQQRTAEHQQHMTRSTLKARTHLVELHLVPLLVRPPFEAEGVIVEVKARHASALPIFPRHRRA